jgi:hypothetical protein
VSRGPGTPEVADVAASTAHAAKNTHAVTNRIITVLFHSQ